MNTAALLTSILIACMVTGFSAGTIKRAYYSDTKLQLNGEDISQDYPPVTVETETGGKIYGSIRSIAEALDATVEWFPGVVGINTTNNRLYVKFNATTVKYATLT